MATLTRVIPFGVLGLAALFLGGCLIRMVIIPGLIPAAWFSVVLTGVAMVMMALGAWFISFRFSEAHPS